MNKCLLQQPVHFDFADWLLTAHTQWIEFSRISGKAALSHPFSLTGVKKKSILRHLWHAGDACLVFPLLLLFSHLCLHFWLVSSARASTPTGLWLTGRICCCPSHNERRQRWEQLNRRDNRSLIQTLMQNLYLLHHQKRDCQASHFQTSPCKLWTGQTSFTLQTRHHIFWISVEMCLFLSSLFWFPAHSLQTVAITILYIYTKTTGSLRNKAAF